MRAESGESALDALRELKLRGDLVAVVLADYRMPRMNGIEFLEQALDVYPGARRVLLTAYADTDAAIDAINVVDLDHCLLKPWDPPEEKLYPVLDDLLQAWRRSDYRPVPSTKVVGHRWSARSSQVREFLARNQVPYRWYSSDEPEGRRLLTAAGQDGQRLPLVVTPDGTPLLEPEAPELAARVGLATTPAADFYDLVVAVGGPAGLGAAVYGASEGLRTVLVERSATGGQAGQSSRIENYPGFPDGVSGAQPTDRARRQAARFGSEILTAREVTGLEVDGAARTARFSDGSAVAAHSVILATGVSYRQLPAAGARDLTGCGVFYGSALPEAPSCRGQDVYIVGGANSAGQSAMHLARGAKSVTLLVRGSSLAASMSYYLVQQIEETPNISVRTGTVEDAAASSAPSYEVFGEGEDRVRASVPDSTARRSGVRPAATESARATVCEGAAKGVPRPRLTRRQQSQHRVGKSMVTAAHRRPHRGIVCRPGSGPHSARPPARAATRRRKTVSAPGPRASRRRAFPLGRACCPRRARRPPCPRRPTRR